MWRSGTIRNGYVAAPKGASFLSILLKSMARVTGLEPATSGVTGRHSNQLSYTRAMEEWV
jgi:hypothetical protein